MPYYVEKLAVLAPLIMRLYRGTPLYNNLGLIEIFFWGPRGCKLKFTAGERERESVCVCVCFCAWKAAAAAARRCSLIPTRRRKEGMDAACKLPEEVASKHLIWLFWVFFFNLFGFVVSVAVTLSFFFSISCTHFLSCFFAFSLCLSVSVSLSVSNCLTDEPLSLSLRLPCLQASPLPSHHQKQQQQQQL